MYPCADLGILWYSCCAGMRAVDRRGFKFPGLFPNPRSWHANIIPLFDLNLSSRGPGALTRQSDAQVLAELRGLRATKSPDAICCTGTAPRCEWTSSVRLRIGVLLSRSHGGVVGCSCVFGSTVLKARKNNGLQWLPSLPTAGRVRYCKCIHNIEQAAPACLFSLTGGG